MNRPSRLAIGASYLASLGHAELEDSFCAALELGFDGVLPSPLARPLAWKEAPALLDRLPLGIPAIRVESPLELAPGSLCSSEAEERLQVRERLGRAARLGAALDCRTLILEAPLLPGLEAATPSYAELPEPAPEARAQIRSRLERERDRHLESACRGLFDLHQAFPDFEICLSESAVLGSLSSAQDLRLLLDEVPRQPLGYWHRAGLVARRASIEDGEEAGACLEALAPYLRGMSVEDASSAGLQELPGTGQVDYGMVLPFTRRSRGDLPVVLDLAPGVAPAALAQAMRYLKKFGLQAGGAA
ncbi:MAG: hypothetical protein CSA62_14100 [Planctomycetota bacterium]|nr:MAG: hypothetical protein CSA62_14100 [Planctomycetota bacterium]